MLSFLTEYDEEKHLRLERKESFKKGLESGKLDTLKSLVDDGILTVDDASKRAEMTVEEFCEKTGLSIDE